MALQPKWEKMMRDLGREGRKYGEIKETLEKSGYKPHKGVQISNSTISRILSKSRRPRHSVRFASEVRSPKPTFDLERLLKAIINSPETLDLKLRVLKALIS